MLERQRVAEEVKGLDQPSRATLRKYGIRFGAYHIYMPGLLKPAPRSLAAQLWALKHEAPDVKGLDELQRLASSGRTSIPVDKETPKALYRTIGYRVCGERAIRVDILERLADLIRPALSWRQSASGEKPAGAFDGTGFTVTGAMTSLTGASGEDFASILRSLGYRMERRPKSELRRRPRSRRPRHHQRRPTSRHQRRRRRSRGGFERRSIARVDARGGAGRRANRGERRYPRRASAVGGNLARSVVCPRRGSGRKFRHRRTSPE